MKVAQWALLCVLLAPAWGHGQNPFGDDKLDASTVANETAPSGVLSNSGMTIQYSIEGVKDLKNLSFSELQAWNFPGQADLQASPDAPAISLAGSVSAVSTGHAQSDAQPYNYRISYWYYARASGNESHTVVEKTVQRPFAEEFSFAVPIKDGVERVGIQVLFQDNSDPGSPMKPSVSLTLNVKLAEPEAAPEWTGTSGSGNLGILAIAAAAAAILAGWILRRRRPAHIVKPDNDRARQTAGYILHASSERLQLRPGQTADLVFTVWRVDGAGNYSPATEAEIAVASPPASSGLQVQPSNGGSPLTCHLTLAGAPQQASLMLDVRARAGGSEYSRQIAVDFEKYEVEFF